MHKPQTCAEKAQNALYKLLLYPKFRTMSLVSARIDKDQEISKKYQSISASIRTLRNQFIRI